MPDQIQTHGEVLKDCVVLYLSEPSLQLDTVSTNNGDSDAFMWTDRFTSRMQYAVCRIYSNERASLASICLPRPARYDVCSSMLLKKYISKSIGGWSDKLINKWRGVPARPYAYAKWQ